MFRFLATFLPSFAAKTNDLSYKTMKRGNFFLLMKFQICSGKSEEIKIVKDWKNNSVVQVEDFNLINRIFNSRDFCRVKVRFFESTIS